MDKDIKKIYNENTIPLVDELVYYFKYICKYIIIKDPVASADNETVDSIKASDLFIACKDNRATIGNFKYTEDELLSYGLNPDNIQEYLEKPSTIPTEEKLKIVSQKQKEYIDNYEELNNYYRRLNGLPDLGDEGIYLTEQDIDIETYNIDISIPIHEMNKTEQDTIIALGMIDTLIKKHPNAKYLERIGSNKIDIFKARKALDYQLLFLPDIIPSEISKRFETEFEKNREYVLRRVWSDAYKYESDNYEGFISILMIVMTLCDIFGKISDFFIKGDIFDLRTIELIFKSNGIEYFPEIPKKYQLAMVRNLNTLKKFKSTTQSIVDISSLFGFDNIEIFKYYILKIRNKDESGNFTFYDDENRNYDLKFLKIPLNDIPDNYIHEPKNYLNYDEITLQDEYWDGEEPHEMIKRKVMECEYNIEKSHYLSIDSVYSMTDLSFQSTYFFTMLFDDTFREDNLVVKIPTISTIAKFRLSDVIMFLFSLGYTYMGITDNILYEPTEVLTIHGFNFEANMAALSEYVNKKGFTLEELGVDKFQIPNSNIMSYNQLMYIYTENKKIYDHLCTQMIEASDRDIYDIYKYLYDALMITNVNMEYFRKKDGTVATGYADFIKEKSPILYEQIEEIRNIKKEDERKTKISNTINDIVYILDTMLDSEEIKYLWNKIPTVSIESVKEYMYKVINFFKSYKVKILNINTLYKFDDDLENKINILDRIRINYSLHKRDLLEIIDRYMFNVYFNKRSEVDIKDAMYIYSYSSNAPREYHDELFRDIDRIAMMYVYLNKRSSIDIEDCIKLFVKMNKRNYLDIDERLFINGKQIEIEK